MDRCWNRKIVSLASWILLFFSAQGIYDTEGEEKNWLENVNAGMTISPGGLPLKTVVEQDSVESLNDNR